MAGIDRRPVRRAANDCAQLARGGNFSLTLADFDRGQLAIAGRGRGLVGRRQQQGPGQVGNYIASTVMRAFAIITRALRVPLILNI